MKNKDLLLTVIGVCAFVALFCGGFIWFLGVVGATWSFLGKIKMVADLILIISAAIAGWLFVSSLKCNKTLKLVLEILFIVFAVLAICGVFGIGM